MKLPLPITLTLLLLPSAAARAAIKQKNKEPSYGVDVSFPIHRRPWQMGEDGNVEHQDSILGDRRAVYLRHLEGCRAVYDPSMCDLFEYDRMLMNRRQPQSMKNYTKVGFKKIRAPQKVVELSEEFWNKNSDRSNWKKENWGEGNLYINHWESPTYQVSVDDKGLRGSGSKLKKEIWAAASSTLEEWTSEELQPVSMYGIRVYTEGAIMLPHVDRLPLVASAMINVAQDVDEDWPFEVYDHAGRAHNVTLHPGDMMLFESHSVIHGHSFPLKGRYYAMLFIHFEPTGHSLAHNASGYYVKNSNGPYDVNKHYRDNSEKSVGGQSADLFGSLPPYISRESPEEENWRKANPKGWTPPANILPPDAHIVAKKGNLEELEDKLAEADEQGQKEDMLNERDGNGWQVLHQGVAGGNIEVVELLVENGAEINARTHGGYGETPLRIAERIFGPLHPISEYLKELGGLSIHAEL